MKRTTLLLLLTTLLVLAGLTACERPMPDSQPPPATATIGVPPLGPTLLPPVAASPTPGTGVTIDPNAPIAASPTPDPAAPVDPAAPPAEATAVPPAPTAAPTQQTSASGEIIHTVAAGENLYRIGLRYGFTYQELAAYNNLANPNALSIGQQIRIPPTP